MRKTKLFFTGATLGCVALIVALIVGLIATSCSKDATSIQPENQNLLKAGSVYLCFDDGPCGNTTTLVSKLKTAGARATFFVWGNRISGNLTGFNAIKSAGFSIQNHSYTHSHMTSWSYSQVYNDLNQCQTAIKNQGVAAPKKFRPPYLETNANIQSACSALGLAIVQPTVYSNDWNGASTAAIVSSVSNLNAGGNALMHDGYSTTNNAISQIVTNLKNKGLSTAQY